MPWEGKKGLRGNFRGLLVFEHIQALRIRLARAIGASTWIIPGILQYQVQHGKIQYSEW